MWDNVTKICAAFLGALMIVSFTLLMFYGKDTAALTDLLQMILSAAGLAAGSGAWVYAGRAAKQTNGGLDQRIEESVHKVLAKVVKTDGRQVLQRPGLDRDGSSGNDGG